ncbi:MAG: FAD-dependent oxidoreductase, partial [Candidatus Omnitrophota bacterium]
MKLRRMDCDVLVAGAGLSGAAAAVAAARRGASVILLEQNDFPGGTPVVALHNFICGVSRDREGLMKEVLRNVAPKERLIKRGRVFILPFKRERMISGLVRIIENENKI